MFEHGLRVHRAAKIDGSRRCRHRACGRVRVVRVRRQRDRALSAQQIIRTVKLMVSLPHRRSHHAARLELQTHVRKRRPRRERALDHRRRVRMQSVTRRSMS
jgi:hypothetical protein